MSSIDIKTLNKWRITNEPHQLIDVREVWEREVSHIDGIHIPLNELLESIEKIRRDIPVVIHCRSGSRSASAVYHLTVQLGFENIYNLEGGIQAWAKEMDPNLEIA